MCHVYSYCIMYILLLSVILIVILLLIILLIIFIFFLVEMSITIKFQTKAMRLPKNAVEVQDLTLIFNVRIEGMHLKVNHVEQGWLNIWPQNGLFPEHELQDCDEALLIASEKVIPNNTTTVYSSTITDSSITSCTTSTFAGRRGNGARPVPTFNNKRKFKDFSIPPKKSGLAKVKNFMKNITISHIDENNNLSTIFDVPINVTELALRHPDFTVDDVQEEVKSQVGGSAFFIITDKRGHPIRDMKNTRGIHLIFLFYLFLIFIISKQIIFHSAVAGNN